MHFVESTEAMMTICGFICILCLFEIGKKGDTIAADSRVHNDTQQGTSGGYVKNPLFLPKVAIGWDNKKDFKLNFRGDALGFKLRRAPMPTIGSPWPKPQKYVQDSKLIFRLQRDQFVVKKTKVECPTLEAAIDRYKEQIFTCSNYTFDNNLRNIYDQDLKGKIVLSEQPLREMPLLTSLMVFIKRCSFWPSAEMNEAYQLSSTADGIEIVANDVWGAIRGLETLSQIVFCSQNMVMVRKTKIGDFPRFRHRGIMVDTARHYIEKETLFQIMRGMEMNKLNVLHWHLTDDQSFPYQSQIFPELSQKGAFHPSLVYTQTDVKDILEFGRQRGIRVVPEIDAPAHVFSWSFGKPELLTQCYDNGRIVPALMGPLNPARNSTYSFLEELYKEILNVFRDQLVHIGGDEVPFQCWNSNPEVVNFAKWLAKQMGSRATDMREVLKYFTKRFIKGILKEATYREDKVRLMVWEESFNRDLFLPKNTVVQLWYSGTDVIPDIVRRNLSVVYSSCWYIDQLQPGIQWHKFYKCDPEGSSHIPGVLGGEVCAWGEHITNEDILVRLWPISSAAAERLWSAKNIVNLDEAAPRLEEHRCRMLRSPLDSSCFLHAQLKVQWKLLGPFRQSSIGKPESTAEMRLAIKSRGLPVSSASGPGFCEIQDVYRNKYSQPRREVDFNYLPDKHYFCNTSMLKFTLIFFSGLLAFFYMFWKKSFHYGRLSYFTVTAFIVFAYIVLKL